MVITDKAKTFIEEHMKEQGIFTFRFTFTDAGCCGPSFGVAIQKAAEKDVMEVVNGIEVAIDQRIADLVKDLTLDFEESEQGAGLVIVGGSNCC